MALGTFIVLFFSTGLAAASGAPGGLFMPMLTLGGAIGLACGIWVEALTGHVPSTYVFAGMGAFVASCSRTPISAMFLAFALTKDLLILKPILVACLASFLVARLFDDRSIYERQLGMELKKIAEDRMRRGGIHHAWEGSSAGAPSPPSSTAQPTERILNQETLLFDPAVPEADALRTVLAFPSTYTVGITSLGYQIVWATLAMRPDLDVRRLFTDQGDPQHRRCELFGLSLSWELDGPVLLDLLEQQRIPIWSDQRSDEDPIVFGGGPVLTANPEPLAPFFDVVLLGDGEDLLPAFIDALQEVRGEPRAARLRHLAQVPGIYVPSLYAPRYDSDGELVSIDPIEAGLPATISKQTWRGNSLSHSTVITPESAWPDIHMVEVVRSCPELCRFCLASYLTLPFRTPSLDDGLIPAVEKGLSATPKVGIARCICHSASPVR